MRSARIAAWGVAAALVVVATGEASAQKFYDSKAKWFIRNGEVIAADGKPSPQPPAEPLSGAKPGPYLKTATRALAGTWTAQGPSPATVGQVEGMVGQSNPVVGAIQAVLPHPTNADIAYAGTVNGGVWRTNNATASSPTWTALTDDMPSLSIGCLEFDIDDATNNTVWAGVARTSSYSQRGGNRIGLLRTTDGGANWTVVDGGGTLVGKNIVGLYVMGTTIVVAVNNADSFACGNLGIFRSTNGGASFALVGNAAGLAQGVATDLERDPATTDTLYTTIYFGASCGTLANGVYKSTDAGLSWAKVSSAAVDGFIVDGGRTRIAVGASGAVFAGHIVSGQLAAVFRSGNGGMTWTQMDTPATNENGTDVGTNPRPLSGIDFTPKPFEAGGQGSIHFSIVASPTNANLVFVGGDRQPAPFEFGGGNFPNSIGANDFSGRLFRGDASLASGSQFVALTHLIGVSTISNSAPHADSRDMEFDANGNILEVDDGGIYRRTNPSGLGDWFSVNGSIQCNEAHDGAYDTLSDILISGNQDTGTTEQSTSGSTSWVSLHTGDGGDVAIGSSGANSVRYSSFQNLGAFRRRVYNSSNVLQSQSFPALSVSAGPAFVPQFTTPVVVNRVAPTRLIFGGGNSVYESTNEGANISEIASGVVANFFDGKPIVAGGRMGGSDNADVLYVGAGTGVRLRSSSGGALNVVPGAIGGSTIRALVVDPENWQTVFVNAANRVSMSTNAGTTWTTVTGDLVSQGVSLIWGMAYIPLSGPDAVAISTNIGVFAAFVDAPTVWTPLGAGLPNVFGFEMAYDAADDVLVLPTMGRGTWILPNVSQVVPVGLSEVGIE